MFGPLTAATHYLPILTTILAAAFAYVLIRASLERRSGPHLIWWAVGAICYGLGTLVESTITLHGNTIELTRWWYVTGALWGGYPLAQGAVYLHTKRRTANILTAVTLTFVILLSVLVFLSPAIPAKLEPTRPSGAVLGWQWLRLMTPFLNLYSAAFLVGGAVASAIKYRRAANTKNQALGNILIAIGGTLPGAGGGLAKAGFVEALYVGELIGLILIWVGYAYCRTPDAKPAADILTA